MKSFFSLNNLILIIAFVHGTLTLQTANAQGSRILVPDMIEVPTGSYMIGSTSGQEDNKPPVRVDMNQPFAISKYEVTFEQYDQFARDTNRKFPDDKGRGRGNKPVVNVTLFDAKAYCEWLSEKTGKKFRIPTEAEWEYVAKYTSRNIYIPINIGKGDASCADCFSFWQRAYPVEVGSFDPNELGVYDLFGNVWEWTCSAYTQNGYNGHQNRCDDQYSINSYSVRGGSFKSDRKILRPYIRYNNPAFYKAEDLGFRIVQDL